MITIVLTLHEGSDWTATYTYVEPIALARALRLWSCLDITIHRIYSEGR